jgi:hypothetical protein
VLSGIIPLNHKAILLYVLCRQMMKIDVLKRYFEKSVELYGGLIKKLLADASN